MRAFLDWSFRLVAFVILALALADDFKRAFWPTAAVFVVVWLIICLMTPGAWRKRD